jgi:hypothetical protein
MEVNHLSQFIQQEAAELGLDLGNLTPSLCSLHQS